MGRVGGEIIYTYIYIYIKGQFVRGGFKWTPEVQTRFGTPTCTYPWHFLRLILNASDKPNTPLCNESTCRTHECTHAYIYIYICIHTPSTTWDSELTKTMRDICRFKRHV